MTTHELQIRLKLLSQRARSICGVTPDGQPLAPQVTKYFDDLLRSTDDPAALKARAEFLARAEKDPEARQTLAGMRIESFDNYIMASSNFAGMFFNLVNLANDERPVHLNRTRSEIAVHVIGKKSQPKMIKLTRDESETMVNLIWLATDKVRFDTVDIYSGSIADAALATLRMSDDFTNQLDGRCFDLMNSSAFGVFTFTGKKANWTYVANSRIKTANLPSTNELVAPTNKFGFPVLATIVDYCARWRGALPGGDIMPTGRILLPPTHIKEIAEGVVPVGASQTAISEEMAAAGYFGVRYLNVNWLFVPDSTLDPDVRKCYPEMNLKAGELYLKPGLDTEYTSAGDYTITSQGEEERWMRKPFGAAFNSVTRPRICRVSYSGEQA